MPRDIILVVEDNPMNRLVALDAFERMGFEVADFATADDAASYAERMAERIAAVFADIQLPGSRDGVDLASMMAERWPHVALVLTAGHVDAEALEPLPPGATFIAKPWTARALIAGLPEGLEANRSSAS